MEFWKVECSKCNMRWILEYPNGLNGASSKLAKGQEKCKCNCRTNLIELLPNENL